MSDLVNTKELTLQLGAPDDETLVMHPEEGRNIDIWTQTEEFNLYLNMDDFIEANDNYRTVTLSQENDFDKGAVQVTNTLKKELENPDNVKVFKKMDNLFLKPT